MEDDQSLRPLWTLHTDILEDVLSLVTSFDVYRLWITGSSMIQSRLRLGVRRFNLGYWSAPLVLWPRIIFNLTKLTSIRLDYAYIQKDLNSSRPDWRLPLESLSNHPIQRLYLSGVCRLLLPFVTIEPGQLAPRSLKSIFPRLKSLEVMDLHPCSIEPHHWQNFPATLELLVWLNLKSSILPPLNKMFPSLRRINVHFQAVDHDSSLPLSLSRLDASTINMEHLETRDDEENLMLRWPMPFLKELQLESWSPNLKPLLLQLPALQSIRSDLVLKVDISNLPDTITSLSLRVEGMLSPSFISSLPRGLQNLFLQPSSAEWIDSRNSLNMLAVLLALPRQLQSCDLSHYIATTGAWTDEQLDALPKTLTSFKGLADISWPSSRSIGSTLPLLKSFRATWFMPEFGEEFAYCHIASLPAKSLTELKILKLEPKDLGNMSRALRSLSSLSEVTLPAAPFRVVKIRDLLDCFSTVRSLDPRLSEEERSRLPSSWNLEPAFVEDEGKEEWFFWSEVEARLARDSLPTAVFLHECTGSQVVASSFLPRQVCSIYFYIDPLGSYDPPQHLGDDQSPISYDDRFSLVKDSFTSVHFAEGAHSGTDYFYRVHSIDLKSSINLKYRVGSLPSSLESFHAEGGLVLSLGDLVTVLPPKLAILGAVTGSVTDQALGRLPRQLRKVVLSNPPNLTSTFSALGLAALPPQLFFLSLPFSEKADVFGDPHFASIISNKVVHLLPDSLWTISLRKSLLDLFSGEVHMWTTLLDKRRKSRIARHLDDLVTTLQSGTGSGQ